jgi:hypothetical protein
LETYHSPADSFDGEVEDDEAEPMAVADGRGDDGSGGDGEVWPGRVCSL